MTPGAWRKQGFTYRLAAEPERPPEPDPRTTRRQHLEQLRTALWHFAATHNGRFPRSDELTVIATNLWEIPEGGDLRYLYLPGREAGHAPALLAYEPELTSDERLVLRVNGDILTMRTAEIRSALQGTEQP
jgi:hypothetical protein